MIRAIFFSKFHTEKGPIVLHQVPDGAIIPSTSATAQAPLFDFSSISDYVIPRQEFCNQLLTVCINHQRVIGYPVCIVDSHKYERNEFIFNFAFVLDEDVDASSYQSVVRKLARLFRSLEEQGSVLSQNSAGPQSKIYALCEMILEDLNNYCECMIPIDESNTLNLKLFPTYPPPAAVRAWHVPLSTVRLSTLADQTWDLTMTRIAPYVDGVASVARIAAASDTDFALARRAVRHLLYYGCLLLLDIFQFGATYAPTPGIARMVADTGVQDECARYVATAGPLLRRDVVVRLYASLRQGVPVKTWAVENRAALVNVDVRRFITFGVIKGFLYRVHKYAVAPLQGVSGRSRLDARRPGSQDQNSLDALDNDEHDGEQQTLARYLDGMHCFDEICTALQLPEKALLERLKGFGDVQVIQR